VRGEFPTLRLEIRSERCNHCDNPPCVYCCPTGASHVHDRGGVVLVTTTKCIGCKACIASCPYDARFMHPEGYADKCTFCIHRVEKGQDPACVSVCPTHCMHFGDLDDPQSEVSRLLPRARTTRSSPRPAPAAHLLPHLNCPPPAMPLELTTTPRTTPASIPCCTPGAGRFPSTSSSAASSPGS
jgi:Fe-S-cluster-containing dehydrogenase component